MQSLDDCAAGSKPNTIRGIRETRASLLRGRKERYREEIDAARGVMSRSHLADLHTIDERTHLPRTGSGAAAKTEAVG
jgi:hypothetical protein